MILGAGTGERTRQGVLDDLDRRLRVFGTDYIDLWYLTSINKPEVLSDDLLEALRAAKQAGKIRACAVSTHSFAAMVPRLLEVRETVTALMVTCNFATWDYRPWAEATENIAKVRQAGIGIVSMKAMLGGLRDLRSVPKDRRAWAEALDTEAGRQAALAAALRWVLRHEQVDTSPVAMSSFEELERNVAAAGEVFTKADQQVLAATLERISPHYCRMCQGCEGSCRAGLPVSDLMRFLLYAEGYGRPSAARDGFAQLPARLRAVRCESCPGCTVRCPKGVRVREQVSRAQAVLA